MLSWLKSSKFKDPNVALGLPSPNRVDITPDKAKICAAANVGIDRRINVTKEMILIVGRRRDVNIKKFDLGSGDNLTKISQMDHIRFFIRSAQDYFIISRRGTLFKKIAAISEDTMVKYLRIINWKTTGEGRVAKSWKDAKVSPVFENSRKKGLCNYRPLNLYFVVCKIMKKMIRKQSP
ncbi:hypothetical protein LSH36_171g08000 [Paralvinella palmiformis]|uniref:Uncharacterized protein n=1 Tax=Paralvinella palmiformis TaxID=53620 RepID=A0AAD9N8V4_9ANNE|nr:hypothetical protein LSH36_171g08000 [Paralvinella palmiformis]